MACHLGMPFCKIHAYRHASENCRDMYPTSFSPFQESVYLGGAHILVISVHTNEVIANGVTIAY